MRKSGTHPLTQVVAAVIERDGKILIARRRKETGFSGFWEFPGGKLEDGETPERGLEREIAKELGVRIKVKEFVHSTIYHSQILSIELSAYRANLLSEDFTLTDHDQIRWVKSSELDEKNFTKPDRPIVRRLVSKAGRSLPEDF